MKRVGRRLALLGATAIVLLLAAILAIRIYSSRHLARTIERFEAEAGSFDLASYAPPKIEDRRQNAALWMRAGADAMLWSAQQEHLLTDRIAKLGEAWPAEDAEAFLALEADHEPARRLLDRAAPLEHSSFEVEYRDGPEAAIPDFLALLRTARLLAVECDYRQQQGDLDGALRSLHLLERLTAVQRAESWLIALLAGAATERLYHDRLEAVLRQVSDPARLLDLRRDLDHLDAATVPSRQPFAADSASVMPWLLSGDATADLASARMQARWRSPLSLPLRALGLDREVAALLLECGLRAVESLERPTTGMTEHDFSVRMLDLHSPVPGASYVARTLSIVPNFFSAIQREQWSRSARALARLAVDLRLSRAGHGRYPPELDGLPVSPASGETATYRVLDDGSVEIAFPAAAESFLAEDRRTDKSGKLSARDPNLRWRLPP